MFVQPTSRPVSAIIGATNSGALATSTPIPRSAIKKPTVEAQQPKSIETIETNAAAATIAVPAIAETVSVRVQSEIEQAASSAVDEIVTAAANVASSKSYNLVEEHLNNNDVAPVTVLPVKQQKQHVDFEAPAAPAVVATNGTHNGSADVQTAEPVAQSHRQSSPQLPAAEATVAAPATPHQQLLSQPHLLEPMHGADPMTASMIKRISTAEEAKIALAERRRLAREEAERQAELERQRLEEADRAEMQRQVEEEERQRCFEEDTLRLVEEQRRAEELRLSQAIEETAQREQEEQRRREDDERQRVEREREEQKAREEAERQKIEVAERLKKEEKERDERRKRVEAIMARTRAKGTPTATPNKVGVRI